LANSYIEVNQMKLCRFALLLPISIACEIGTCVAADLVTVEAESGVLGADFTVNNGSPAYITTLANGTGNNPGDSAHVASYTITFPAAGNYQLYTRLRVGPDGFNDDSMFFASGFGVKSPTLNSDWVFVNGLAGVGYTEANDIVNGAGAAGNQVWKWINLSQFTGNSGFTVSDGNLTQTFQIAAREDGLDMDKFVFGSVGTAFTVMDLDSGIPTNPVVNTNTFPGPDGIALHRFSSTIGGLNLDGANPESGLALFNGVLCGTTRNGGSQGAGVAFTLSLDGMNFETFRVFTNAPDAGNPQGELLFSANRFFSTTFSGGVNNTGALIVGQTNGVVTILRNMAAVNADTATNSGGASPVGSLALSGATVYGTTRAGGTAGNGTIFSQTTNDSTFTTLHNFSSIDSQTGANADGAVPTSGLILSDGTLYGTTSGGGDSGNGVVFSVETNGVNFMTLHSFSALDTTLGTNADGAIPYGGLVLANGTLYGTTYAGGVAGRGAIFSVRTNGTGFTVLHHFTTTDPVTGVNFDGASPAAALLLSSNVLYGATPSGGAGAAGTVFSLSLANLRFATIHNFAELADDGTNADGAFPVAPLLRVGNFLYGTTFSGGPGAAGVVFGIPIPPPPVIITNILKDANGNVTLWFRGSPNSTNVIQSADSLTPSVSWRDVATNVADSNGEWQFTEAVSSSNQFYRSYQP
jgi:uncharacterized repeat protein (TIGR03803 family)